MAITLKVPALEDKPLIVAETRVPKVLEFVSNLPISKLNESASTLLEELEILNRQHVSADARVKVLEAYRPTIINLTESLKATYANATLPLSNISKERAALAESLWLELGYGYKLALLEMQSQLFNLKGNKSTAFVIIRAIEAATQLSLVYYQTYFSVPGNVWTDTHQLYFYAVQQGIHELEIEADHPFTKTSSINQVYKQIILLAISDPQHLGAQDTALVADYIYRHANQAKLQGLGVVENFAGVFLIKLNEDKAPIPYLKNELPTDGGTDILLLTIDLARLVHQHLQALQAKTPLDPKELPENGYSPKTQDILVHLIKHWGTPPKRVFNRSKRQTATDMSLGVVAVHFFVNGEKPYLQPISAAKTVQLDEAPVASIQIDDIAHQAKRWQIVNISAGGLALRQTSDLITNVKIGQIACLRNVGESTWSIGVLRWANNDDKNMLEVGAQLLSPSAIAGGVRQLNQGKFEHALILPPMPAIKQDVSVIANTGTYSPARILELDEQGKVSRIMLTRLIERTDSFERFSFSYL